MRTKTEMAPPDFRHRKAILAFWILGIGLAVAIAWSIWAGWVLHEGFPKAYLFPASDVCFTDFTDETRAAALSNPYLDPISIYPPAAFVFLRALPFSDRINLIGLDFLGLAGLALLLYRVLPTANFNPWVRLSFAFLFLALSHPLLFCLDRGNIDILAFPLVGWALYFYIRRRDLLGTLCLFPIICLKLYPAIFLFLLLRRGKTGLAVVCGLAALAINAACFCFYPAPPAALWHSYQHDLVFFRDYFFLDINGIENRASLWNTYKICLVSLYNLGLGPRIEFGFHGPFIAASYRVYLNCFALFSVICLGYAACLERHLTRAAVMLLLLVTLSLPSGPDYRMFYVSMAVVLLVLVRPRRGDLTALILLALAVIPKREIFLSGTGKEPQFDAPTQALLDPLFILAAMVILLGYSLTAFAWPRVAHRLRFFPSLRSDSF